MHDGLDQDRLDRLVGAIEQFAEEFRDAEAVPKVLALAFVDVGNHFFFPEGAYPKDELERIEDAGIRLSELANGPFGSD